MFTYLKIYLQVFTKTLYTKQDNFVFIMSTANYSDGITTAFDAVPQF